MSLRLVTLGSPRVFSGETELNDLPAQRLRFALLAFLAVEGEAPREMVLSLFWPDRDPPRARHALRQMLYELKQLLGEDWLEVSRDRIVVRANVDAVEFERAATENRATDALALYEGAFLDGFGLDNHSFESWVDRQRAHLARRHRRLSRDHIAELLEAGRTEPALQVAQRWVDLDPLEDEASHALIRCLALTGQRLAALQYYESYERQLAAELQVEPLEETQALIAQIRAGDVVAPPLPGVPLASDAVEQTQADASPMPEQDAVPAKAPHAPLAERRPQEPVASAAGPRPRTRWRRPLAAAAVVTIAVAAVAVGSNLPDSSRTSDAPAPRVLILPFSHRASDSTLAAFAGVLTDDLTRSLSLSRPLAVVPGTGLARLQADGISLDSLRRLASADYVVTGAVTRLADSVRVGIELIDGRTGSMIRSEIIEGGGSGTRSLADDVVARAAGLLRREVGSQVAVRRERSLVTSDEAWRLTLEARTAQDRMTRLVQHGDFRSVNRALTEADSLLARAAELDRRWAEPLVRRGWLMDLRALVLSLQTPGDTAGRRKLLEAGRSMGERVIERDPRDARGWELHGVMQHRIAQLQGERPDSSSARLLAAENDLRRATQLDPNSTSAWRRLAELLYSSGRHAAAKNAAEKAWEIDPFATDRISIINQLFATSLELHEDQEAARWCAEGRRLPRLERPFVYCLFALHAWAEGVKPDPQLLRRELESFDRLPLGPQPEFRVRLELLLAATHARAGQADSARSILGRAGAEAPLWLAASIHANLDEPDTAVSLLTEYLKTAPPTEARLVRSRPFHKLQGRPGYQRLLTM